MILFDESLTSSSHMELFFTGIGAFAALLVPIWRDIRKGQRESDNKQQKRHEENIERFTTLETKFDSKVEPMHTWWIGKINGGNH